MTYCTVIIGSEALAKAGFNIAPKDTDRWVNDKSLWLNVEKADISEIPADIISCVPRLPYPNNMYASPDAVYTILCSHLGWDSGQNNHSKLGGSVQWDKYKQRILYLRGEGCSLIPELYEKLLSHWKKEFGNKEFLSLKKNKDDFFNDYVPYKHDHDLLHAVVASPNEPMYRLCLKDGEDVLTSKERFDKMSFGQQVQMFREEIGVIALERWVIPCGESFHLAWIKSVKKTITQLTKNWATEFLVFNLEQFLKPDWKMYDNYLSFVEENKKAGECK